MKKLATNLSGLLLGGLLGWMATPTLMAAEPVKGMVAAVQAIISYRIDPANATCWDQPGLNLSESNLLRVEVSYDAPLVGTGGTFQATAHECKGVQSPWQCNVKTPMPLSLQTAGRHRTIVRSYSVDPVDGSVSAPSIAADFLFDLRNAPAPPPPGVNGRIIKIILGALAGLMHFFGG